MKNSMFFRVLIGLAGLGLAYAVYGFALFLVALGHMNPRLPRYYVELSLGLQFLPLMLSAISWFACLVTLKRKWLWTAAASLLWVAVSLPLLQAALPYLPPAASRYGSPEQVEANRP
ncbi:hypothetical protein OL229_03470 [Neisseriaceae bacterium JH1-16]|nr:hypothetical protein [Neisseriaceae bacterium JH1-16]